MIESIKKLKRVLLGKDFFYKKSVNITDKRYGSAYGGWWVAPQYVNSSSVVLSFGLGEDISFDLAFVQEFGCTIYGFDPTPKSLAFLDTLELPENFSVHPMALSDKDGTLTFNLPENDDHVSGSLESICSSKSITVPCQSIKSIVKQLDLETVDVLKMDIEGSEYSVVKDMLETGVLPKQLLIEYHHFFDTIPHHQTKENIELLLSNEYELFHIEAYNYSFIHKSVL